MTKQSPDENELRRQKKLSKKFAKAMVFARGPEKQIFHLGHGLYTHIEIYLISRHVFGFEFGELENCLGLSVYFGPLVIHLGTH